MNSYIYDKMPARIVGCTETQEINFSNDEDIALQLHLWEEDYDYLVLCILPMSLQTDSYVASGIYNNDVPYQGIFPLYQIIPKNASSFLITGLCRGGNKSDVPLLGQEGKISIDQNNIITITQSSNTSDYGKTQLINFIAYKNNI